MKKLVALLMVLTFGSFACYTSYHISMDQLKELQASDQAVKIVDTEEGKKVEVSQNTRLFVRAVDGKRWPITPFNFKVTNSQLVASDRDYIFMTNQLKPKGEIDLLSTFKTVGLIGLGAAAVTGLIIVTVATAGKKSFSSN